MIVKDGRITCQRGGRRVEMSTAVKDPARRDDFFFVLVVDLSQRKLGKLKKKGFGKFCTAAIDHFN